MREGEKSRVEALVVTPAEAGQKLLQFLTRRFDAPQSVFHRWIRSGQVRINGGRAKPFNRVEQGDDIRVPPFAVRGDKNTDQRGHSEKSGELEHSGKTVCSGNRPLPPVVAETADMLVFCKPAGLPVHPGTGHTDSLTTRLAARYRGTDFMPTPVHRLDRDTSGLLLVAKTYTSLRRLADAFASHDGRVTKEYLLWVRGDCPWSTPKRLEDRLAKQANEAGYEKVETTHDTGKDASLTALCVRQIRGWSLLLVQLHTGRTHQIRVQLAERGFPLAGDVKYGGPPCDGGLKLHAARLTVGGERYEALPPWKNEWTVTALPPPL